MDRIDLITIQQEAEHTACLTYSTYFVVTCGS